MIPSRQNAVIVPSGYLKASLFQPLRETQSPLKTSPLLLILAKLYQFVQCYPPSSNPDMLYWKCIIFLKPEEMRVINSFHSKHFNSSHFKDVLWWKWGHSKTKKKCEQRVPSTDLGTVGYPSPTSLISPQTTLLAGIYQQANVFPSQSLLTER